MKTQENTNPPKKVRRRTKIVATVGPASSSPERVAELIDAGVNVFRLNFSHGSHEVHLKSLQTIRQISKSKNSPVAILQDLSGPKIRISQIEGDFAAIKDGEKIELRKSIKGQISSSNTIYVEGLNPCEVAKAGQQVLLADGIIELKALDVNAERVVCEIVKGGRIRSRVGIAFPESVINLPATTDKDMVDLAWGIENKVDFVAISFVQNAEDIARLRSAIRKENVEIHIISKIERRLALQNIEEILEASDGVMVARGDLGLELPVEQVPTVQRQIIELANKRGIPVIVATQMLTSMVTAVRPTRAEVSDVATAVMSGADAVMLSEETTIGENPVECVRYLNKIAVEAERSFEFEEFRPRLQNADRESVPDAVAYAACAAALKIDASAVIGCTETGTSVRLIAKYRPKQALYGISSQERTVYRMCLYWGVHPLFMAPTSSHSDEIASGLTTVQKLEQLANGSKAIITGGLAVRTPGATSVMEVREFIYL